jgi:hypothetical protein
MAMTKGNPPRDPTKGAIRARRWYRRTCFGRWCLRVDVDRAASVIVAMRGGTLDPADIDDRDKVAASISRVLEALAASEEILTR